MNKNLSNNEQGITHILMIGLAAAVLGIIVVIGIIVAGNHKTNSVALITPASDQLKAKSTITNPQSSAKEAGTTASTPTTSSSTTSVSASTPKSTATVKTTAPSTTASPSPSTSTTSSPVVPQGYTNIGTISASSLYDVKVPPPSSEQPNMTLYACINNLGSNTANVQIVGTLSYPIPQSASGAWYTDVDLSSSAAADNPVNSKSGTYSYPNNAWLNNGGPAGTVNETSTVTSLGLNPGVITDFYVWASGSYGDSTWPGINNHPNVTQLNTCN